jgi:hypothetical protein
MGADFATCIHVTVVIVGEPFRLFVCETPTIAIQVRFREQFLRFSCEPFSLVFMTHD